MTQHKPITRSAIERLIRRLEELHLKVPREYRDDLIFVINMLRQNPPDGDAITIYLDQDYRW